MQSDGETLVGGYFSTLARASRDGIGRLNSTDPATQDVALAGSTVTWLRGGTSPEVWRTTFELCTDGTNWTSLGAGTRISGGWQFTGVSVPAAGTLRARGFVTGGQYNGSSWFVESKIPVAPTLPPMILVNDGRFGFRTNEFGFNLTGSSGQVVVVQCSTNLLNWTPLTTNTLGSGPLYFSDSGCTNFPQRYYRLLAP